MIPIAIICITLTLIVANLVFTGFTTTILGILTIPSFLLLIFFLRKVLLIDDMDSDEFGI
jgi:hypothetical protein